MQLLNNAGQQRLDSGTRRLFRRYDFVDNAQHFQVIPTKVGIQMFFFGVRLPGVIEQLRVKKVMDTTHGLSALPSALCLLPSAF